MDSRNNRLVIRALERREMDAMLRRNRVARLAYHVDGRIEITPVHYVYSGGDLIGRTSPGTKLTALSRDSRVTVEVDEADGLYDWRSVVIRSAFHRIPTDGSPRARERYADALSRIRSLVPETFTPDDPVRSRSVLFRIPVRSPTGRAAGPELDQAG